MEEIAKVSLFVLLGNQVVREDDFLDGLLLTEIKEHSQTSAIEFVITHVQNFEVDVLQVLLQDLEVFEVQREAVVVQFLALLNHLRSRVVLFETVFPAAGAVFFLAGFLLVFLMERVLVEHGILVDLDSLLEGDVEPVIEIAGQLSVFSDRVILSVTQVSGLKSHRVVLVYFFHLTQIQFAHGLGGIV